MRPAFAALALHPALARSAPDELALGKAEGYPICGPAPRIETRCLVGELSRRDEVYPSRKVAKGESALALKRAEPEPSIRFRFQGEALGLDDYLGRHRTTGLVILKDDTLVAERYQYDRTPAHRMTSMSVAKTIVAMLVGIAIAERRIGSIDDLAQDYVPVLEGSPYGQTPIRHLLSMSSGVRFTENYSGHDDVAILARLSLLGESEGGPATLAPFRARERDRKPGERFHYASSETQVLGLVLRAATGMPLADYVSEKIWKPMGAEADASWLVDRGGFEAAFTGFNATVRDYARFGLLLANEGRRGREQVIPAEWVRAATTPPAGSFAPGRTGSLLGYGYQTWLLPGPTRQFVLRGVRGQAVFVDPVHKVVMVRTAAAGIGDPGFTELLALWDGVVSTVAGQRRAR
jgi:CubicO group peptidase (beta-lactamase class C family)